MAKPTTSPAASGTRRTRPSRDGGPQGSLAPGRGCGNAPSREGEGPRRGWEARAIGSRPEAGGTALRGGRSPAVATQLGPRARVVLPAPERGRRRSTVSTATGGREAARRRARMEHLRLDQLVGQQLHCPAFPSDRRRREGQGDQAGLGGAVGQALPAGAVLRLTSQGLLQAALDEALADALGGAGAAVQGLGDAGVLPGRPACGRRLAFRPPPPILAVSPASTGGPHVSETLRPDGPRRPGDRRQ